MSEKEKHDMFWADQIAREAKAYKGKHVVGDAKTPSGRIHVGSLRGLVIHDLIHKAVLDSGQKSEYVYRFDDFDPMDGFPPDLPESYRKYMGEPLCNIPSPEKGFDSLAQYYALEFKEVFEKLGCNPKIVWASEAYHSGKMNEFVRIALENAEKIREINVRISGAKKQEGWLPINVVCEKCGKIGTTHVTDFDGKTVHYACVGAKYADGCKQDARISPFDGNAKLTWKVEWAAQFKLYEVTIEGAGKDHYASGGARDVSNEITEKVFNYPAPYNFPYEFFLFGGRKMSSSKGIGLSAKSVSDSLPPELLRFVFTKYKPKTAIEFNPEGETIPRLYDDWDKFSRVYFGKEESRDPDVPRIFALSQLHGKPKEHFHPQFSFVAFLVQVPGVDVAKAIEKHKGAELTKEESEELAERVAYAKLWLEKFADENAKISIAKHADWNGVSDKAREALAEYSNYLNLDESGQSEKVKEICAGHGISVQEFYKAAYRIFISRDKGPKLIPFLNALDKEFVEHRLKGKA
ncbi:MAG: lysine--tRNA ligase [Candidatus Norongarragalinales archaeon]